MWRLKSNTRVRQRRPRVATEEPEGAAEWVKRVLGLEPDSEQARILQSKRRRGMLNCTKQWGKSTIAAAKTVHEAWSKAGSLSLVVSPSARQSGEFVRKAAGFARRLGVERKGDGDKGTGSCETIEHFYCLLFRRP
jgi:hypothetical protein